MPITTSRLLVRRVDTKHADAVRADVAKIAAAISGGQGALMLGATGKAVEALQRHLRATGVYAGPVSGTFDTDTQAALQTFQDKKKLSPTGTVDKATLGALKDVNLFIKDGFKGTPGRIGQRGADIGHTEKLLEKLGYAPGAVDGIFDEKTQAALSRFRRADKQVQDGGKGITRNLYKELSRASSAFEHDPLRRRQVQEKATTRAKAHRLDERTEKAAKRTGGIALGDKGTAITNLERHLNAAGYSVGRANKSFGPRTLAALKAFQEHSGLEPTGTVNAKTWSKLRGSLFSAKSGTSPVQRQGEKSAAVKRSEKLLRQLKFKTGKVDGFFSSKTAAAVKRFQAKHHLDRTGAVNGRTLKALQKAAHAGSAGQLAKKVLAEARKHLGFHEGAGNANPFSKFFGRPGEAWCADFVSYCFTKSGHPLNFASVDSLLAHLKANHAFHTGKPKPGDIVIFDWDRGDSDPSEHTGMVEKVFQKGGQWFVQTIEGNSGDRVQRNTWPLGSSKIVGYGTFR
jgi:peptidoglycan hydrolase-like protein with peptidoglycan-binding domain